MSDKLIVVWICHFSNSYILEKLNIHKKVREFAPWITLGIEEVKKHKEIELHVISPHKWISGVKTYSDKNINYYFYNFGIPFYGRHWPQIFRWDIFTKFFLTNQRIKNIVFQIRPDIIHLHGLENAYYSSSVLQFIGKFPILATIQGFIGLQVKNEENANFKKTSLENKKRMQIESLLLKKLCNIGVRDDAMKNEVLSHNIKSNIYWHEYFININNSPKYEKHLKIFDIIFYTRVTKTKGIEDLIDAVKLLVNDFPKIRIAVVGKSDNNYLNFLGSKIKNNNCQSNFQFFGFLPKQEDIYDILKQSKIYVLPAYLGDVNGGVIECMTRKIPVVVNDVGGFHFLNAKEEVVLLTKKGDIFDLALKIKTLLVNETYRTNLAEKAFKYSIARWNNKRVLDDILLIYKKILKQ